MKSLIKKIDKNYVKALATCAAVFFTILGCVTVPQVQHDHLSLQLDYVLQGDPNSDVTVIFETGGNGLPFNVQLDMKSAWTKQHITDKIAPVAQVLIYNRAE